MHILLVVSIILGGALFVATLPILERGNRCPVCGHRTVGHRFCSSTCWRQARRG
jgi:hypothetical protein